MSAPSPIIKSLHLTWDSLSPSVVEQQWLLIPLSILCLIISRRHSILSYGSQSKNWWIYLAVTALSMLGYSKGLPEGLVAQLQLFSVVLLMDNVINSLQLQRSPFFTFNLGLLIGLLSLTHTSYLLFGFLLAMKCSHLDFNTPRHYSSMFMGILTPWLFFFFLTTTPSWPSIQNMLYSIFQPIWGFAFSTRASLLQSGVILLYALLATSTYYQSYLTSTIRTRYVIRMHQQIGWLFLLLHFLYGASDNLFNSGFLITGLFFLSQPITYFTTLPIPSNRFLPFLFATLTILLIGITCHTQCAQFFQIS